MGEHSLETISASRICRTTANPTIGTTDRFEIDYAASHTENQIGEVRRQLQQHQEQLDFFVRTNQPPHEGVVFEGHLLEGREVAESLIKSAKREIVLIDTYVGADTFHILEAREAGVAATIYTEKTQKTITPFSSASAGVRQLQRLTGI